MHTVFKENLLAGKRVHVSGGTRGIGLALAQGFSDVGASVIASGSSQSGVDTARQENERENLRFACLDVQDRGAVTNFYMDIDDLNVLVNCQGIARREEEWDEDTFLKVLDINLASAFRLSNAAFPLLAKSGGNIINIASMLSYLADPFVPAYCASKTGLVGLTRSMAHRYSPKGVRVNAIAPGYHTTDMTEPLWSQDDDAKQIAERSAMKRWGTVEDLVGPALFLASESAGFVTGAVLPVDGGYHTG